jgi:two-component system sensor histidine kinase PilS (NtrC family)
LGSDVEGGETKAPSSPTPKRHYSYGELRSNLRTLILSRVVIVTFLLAATALFGLTQHEPSRGVRSAEGALYALVVAVYLLSVGYAIALRVTTELRWLLVLAYLQLTGDALFAAVLVLVTGGTASVFTFFFSLSIVLAAIILFRAGAIYAATASSVMLLVIGLIEVGFVGPSEWVNIIRRDALLAGEPVADVASSVGYNLVVNVIAFYAIAMLASYLADQLRRTDIKLEQNRVSLEDLRALHENIISSIQSGLITVNQNHQITFFNHFAEAITGHESTEVLYKDITRFFGDLRQIFSNEDKLHSQHEELTSQILRGRVAFVRWTISPLLDSRGERIGHVLIFDDVTRVREMEARMKRDDQFATLGKLASAIAHEIRNPLASISGSIQLLSQTIDLEDDDRRLMNIISRETDTLNQWITDFLTFARPRYGDRVPVDFRGMISDAALVLKQDPKSEKLVLNVEAGEEALVLADPTYLKQVLWNILQNAVQAMPEGGELTITLEPTIDERGEFFRASFKDTGGGIPEAVRERVFEPFFTTKQGGTGLGLPTVYRIVTEHGGAVTVDSELDVGTTFTVALPRYHQLT